MESELTYSEVLAKCQFLSAKCEYCIYDMKQKMYRWGVPSDLQQKVVDSLVEDKFIDDLRFATAYVKDKTRFNHWGRIKTTIMLRQKHIAQPVINEAFAELPEQDYRRAFETERDKKFKQLRALEPYQRRQKTASYLIQKGFEPDMVFKELDVDE